MEERGNESTRRQGRRREDAERKNKKQTELEARTLSPKRTN